MTGSPSTLTASETAALVADGTLSAVEVVTALIDQIDQTEPRLLAWETIDRNGALAQAEQADRDRAVGGPSGPLDGVCVAVKDMIDTAGMPTGAGFGPFAKRVAKADSEVVSRLRARGAIILGKVSTAQFAFADPPRTRSPWDDSRTPGGSSTGSGVAVAARHVPMSVGTQTGGSVLRPSAYNGVIGFKPTYGRIPQAGVLPMAWSLDHVGVLARSVEDCALFLRVAGEVPAPSPSAAPSHPLDLPPRIGVLSAAFEGVTTPVVESVTAAIERFSAGGAIVTSVELEHSLSTFDSAFRIIMQSELAAVHGELFDQHREHYGPQVRANVEVGRLLPATAYLRANRVRRMLAVEFQHLFSDVDVVVLPVVPDLPPERSTTGSSALLAPFSLLGVPTMSLPCGLSQGLPQAVQLVGARGADEALLRVAQWCARLLPPVPLPVLEAAWRLPESC